MLLAQLLATSGSTSVSGNIQPWTYEPDMSAMISKPKLPSACADMPEVRAEIDRVDAALVALIAERFGYVERAWQIKLAEKAAANVPWRNQQVIDKVRGLATEQGVSPDLCEALWRQMIGWFIQYEEEKLRAEIEAKQ
jgi:isochorismate pyruvate lyase